MSCVAVLLLAASQTLSGGPGEAIGYAGRGPVAEPATATVRVLRPARIVREDEATKDRGGQGSRAERQRRIDPAGTIWIEFS
jgi:hypothetical protein